MLFELLVRGGATVSMGERYEVSLLGTQFDVSQLASNWGMSNMWIATALWLGISIVIIVAVNMTSNAFDCWFIIMMIMATVGWRYGLADTYYLVAMLVMASFGIVYGIFFKKAF